MSDAHNGPPKHYTILELLVALFALIGGVITIIGFSIGISYYLFDVQNRTLQVQLAQSKDKNEDLRQQLAAVDGAVKYGVSDQTVYLKKNSFIIDSQEAKTLLGKGHYILKEDMLLPDYESRGYEFHDNFRLKQLTNYLKDRSIPLPDKDNPDDETDPLWWPKCWAYDIAADEKGEEGDILICKIPLSKFDQIFGKASDVLSELHLQALNPLVIDGIPRTARSFVVFSTLAKDGGLTLSSLSYQDNFFFCEGEFIIPQPNGKSSSFEFTFVSFETDTDVVSVYVGARKSDAKLDLRIDETRGFIKDFRSIR